MSVGKKARKRYQKINDEGSWPRSIHEEHVYCYCDAWNLTWPHYKAEHDADHDLAKLTRIKHADGPPQ